MRGMLHRIWIKGWLYTAIVVLAILYLTLVPRPLPSGMDVRIPGIDKLVHAIMFGGLTFTASLDMAYRRDGFERLSPRTLAVIAVSSAAFGGIVEVAQGLMGLGRGCDIWDFVADASGSLLSALLVGRMLSRNP